MGKWELFFLLVDLNRSLKKKEQQWKIYTLRRANILNERREKKENEKNKNKLRISYKLKQKISLLCEKQLSLLLYSVTCNYSNSTGYRRNFHWRKYICSAFLKKNLKGGFRRSDRKMFFLVLLPFTTLPPPPPFFFN